MNFDTLLSLSIGLPVALLAMLLLFRVDTYHARRSPAPPMLNATAAGVTALLVILVVARFVNYA
jgi:hypothetical protein